jgi:transcriptional regulator with XRE-family HTH domain
VDSINDLIAANLVYLRERKGMSQLELASSADLSQGFIADIERKNKQPSLESLEKICWALGVPPYRLLLSPSDISQMDSQGILKDMVVEIKEDIERRTDAILRMLDDT